MLPIKRVIPILFVLSLVAAACSLPGASPSPTGTQAPPAASETLAIAPSTETVPPPTPQQPLSPPIAGVAQNVTLTSLKMFDSQNGWAAATGNSDDKPHLLRTADGGTTWQERTPASMSSTQGYDSALIIFTTLDINTVWATLTNRSPAPANEHLITWHTSDGGDNWSSSEPLPVRDLSVEFFMPDSFGFSDPSHGWLLVHNGAGMNHDYVSIFTSADGGQTWLRVVDPYMDNLWMSCSKTGLVFFDANRGWITYNCHGVKNGLDFYATTDGGHTWQAITLPPPGISPDYFSSMENYCGIDGIVYALDPLITISITCMHSGTADPNRWLYTSPDAGSTWTWKTMPGGYGDSFFLTPNQGWFLGHIKQQSTYANTLYATTDAGVTWTSLKSVNWGGIPQFMDAKNGWVLARAGQETAFVRTTNGGLSWQEITPVIKP